jgi:hypothetical protein
MESTVSHRILFPLPVAARSFILVGPSRFAILVLGVLSVGSIGGCKGNQSPVHGRVTLDGKPLARATVVFVPVVRGKESRGVTNDNGEYILKYIREEQGGTVGKNRVQITKLRTHAESSDLVPAKYNRETTLSAEVTFGDNVFDFALSSK